MFKRFQKSKFLKKCESALSRINIRIDGIKRKRNAMQKYLKNDVADLLMHGYHLIAFNRAEGLLIDMNKSACYDLVEQFCKTISEHLSVMNNQKECPEECKEAVQSLIFAAARFSDLPELRELRTLFDNKYGKSIESQVNREFVEKLKPIHPTKDMKIQLLNDVASGFELEWDPKALEQQLDKPSPRSEQVWSENDDDSKIITKDNRNRTARERDQQNLERDVAPMTNEDNEVPSERTEASDDDNNKSHDSEINPSTDRIDDSIANDKADSKKPISYRLIPPPYTKPKADDPETSSRVPSNSGNPSRGNSVGEAKPEPKSVWWRQLKPLSAKDDTNGGRNVKTNSAGIGNKNENSGLEAVRGDDCDYKTEKKDSFHSRTVSLPPAEISTSEAKKGHGRSFSLPEFSHRKTLDYDDFMARLAALRQN